MTLAQPWPLPTFDELVSALEEFMAVAHQQQQLVGRQEYERIKLWFHSDDDHEQRLKEVVNHCELHVYSYTSYTFLHRHFLTCLKMKQLRNLIIKLWYVFIL